MVRILISLLGRKISNVYSIVENCCNASLGPHHPTSKLNSSLVFSVYLSIPGPS